MVCPSWSRQINVGITATNQKSSPQPKRVYFRSLHCSLWLMWQYIHLIRVAGIGISRKSVLIAARHYKLSRSSRFLVTWLPVSMHIKLNIFIRRQESSVYTRLPGSWSWNRCRINISRGELGLSSAFYGLLAIIKGGRIPSIVYTLNYIGASWK